jgi:transcriptional regulator
MCIILHNLNVNMHKSSLLRKSERDLEESVVPKADIEHQDRIVKVLTLHSKGFSQSEIAKKLNVNQSTVSRDLDEIRRKARKTLDLYMREEIPNELQIYISGLNEITKNLWEIVEDKENPKITTRDRTYVLSLLMQCYSKRMEMLIGGPESELNATKHMRDIKDEESNPILSQRY